MSSTDRSVPVDAGLYDDAERDGARAGRSADVQLEYWTRLGRSMDQRASVALARVRADGATWAALSNSERHAVNLLLDVEIEQASRAAALGAGALARGYPVAALDETGTLVRYLPDGTTEIFGS